MAFKKLLPVFIIAFFLNWLWEELHSLLYLNYQGGEITHFVLFRAAIFDAIMISMLVFIAQTFFARKYVFFIVFAIILSVAIEMWALSAGRWAYGAFMPVIPVVWVGLTPAIQLAVTGFIAQKIVFRKK